MLRIDAHLCGRAVFADERDDADRKIDGIDGDDIRCTLNVHVNFFPSGESQPFKVGCDVYAISGRYDIFRELAWRRRKVEDRFSLTRKRAVAECCEDDGAHMGAAADAAFGPLRQMRRRPGEQASAGQKDSRNTRMHCREPRLLMI
jgi:hypothetical protein